MSARPEPTTVLSSAAVGLAIVGAALPETLLQVAGPLLRWRSTSGPSGRG